MKHQNVIEHQIAILDKLILLEKQNAALLEALQWLLTAIMPEERKYDEWGYCRIHKDILYEFDAVINQAIAQVEGFTPTKGGE